MKGGQPARARAAFERALSSNRTTADADNSLGALLAQSGDVPAAIERFRAALAGEARLPRRAQQPGVRACSRRARPPRPTSSIRRRWRSSPTSRKRSTTSASSSAARATSIARSAYFQQAVDAAQHYGEAANNLALVLAARGETDEAVAVLQRLLQENPAFEMAYVTLCQALSQGRTARRTACRFWSSCCRGTPRTPSVSSSCGRSRPGADRMMLGAEDGFKTEGGMRLQPGVPRRAFCARWGGSRTSRVLKPLAGSHLRSPFLSASARAAGPGQETLIEPASSSATETV